MIIGIVAVDEYDGIGYKNDLLFKSKADMEHFRKTTTNHIVVMGKNTFVSLKSKPLKDRLNIVLSSSLNEEDFKQYDNLIICKDKKSLLKLIAKLDKEDERNIFIMGGGRMYSEMQEYIDSWIVTIFKEAAENVDTYLEVDFQPFEKIKTETLSDGLKVDYYERD